MLDPDGTRTSSAARNSVTDTRAKPETPTMELFEDPFTELAYALSQGVLSQYGHSSGKAMLNYEGGGLSHERTVIFQRSDSFVTTVTVDGSLRAGAGLHTELSTPAAGFSVEGSIKIELGLGGKFSWARSQQASTTTTIIHLEDSSIGGRVAGGSDVWHFPSFARLAASHGVRTS